MPELKTLTIGGTAYDSFVDKDARQQIEKLKIDESVYPALYVTAIGDFDLSSDSGAYLSEFSPDWQTINDAYNGGQTIRFKFQTLNLDSLMLENIFYDGSTMRFGGVYPEESKTFSAEITDGGIARISWEMSDFMPAVIKTTDPSNSGTLDYSSGFAAETKPREISLFGESWQGATPTSASPSNIQSIFDSIFAINEDSAKISLYLRGIKNDSGDWVARDEITVKDGSVHLTERVGELTIKSDFAGWTVLTVGSQNLVVAVDPTRMVDADGKNAGATKNSPMLCSHFEVRVGLAHNDISADQATNNENYLYFKVPVSSIGYSGKDKAEALAAWKNWLYVNEPKLVYIRKTPIETDITETETGRALLAMMKEYPYINWLFDGDASISYHVNVEKSIDDVLQKMDAVDDRVDRVDAKIDEIGRQIGVATTVKKVLFLGDSITAGSNGGESWVNDFLAKINGELVANVAVGGAVLADIDNTAYDGNPQSNTPVSNVLGNQVQKILNNDYEAPDIIMISVGTNSGIRIKETVTDADVASGYSSIKDTYYKNNELVPLDDVVRTTDAGAFRYASETLHKKYPNAVIFWCSPIHSADTNRRPNKIYSWHKSLELATEYTGQRNIDTLRCGVFATNKNLDESYEDFIPDGLHLNKRGANKVACYNAEKVNATILPKNV